MFKVIFSLNKKRLLIAETKMMLREQYLGLHTKINFMNVAHDLKYS